MRLDGVRSGDFAEVLVSGPDFTDEEMKFLALHTPQS